MTVLCCCYAIAVESNDSLKDYIPLISPLVVIILFIIDRIIGFRLRRKEIERNWYLKVLIEPGISKISEFYKRVNELFESSAQLLADNHGISHSDFVSIKAKENGKFQSLKRGLEADVIFAIQMRYSVIGEDLTNCILDLEDTFTSYIDKENYSADTMNSFHTEVANNRARLLTILYTPLKP